MDPVVYRNFSGGVNTAMAPDNLPITVSPWGRNAVLEMVSADQAIPACRGGFRVLNQTALSGSPTIVKVVGFTHIDSDTGTTTHYLLAVSGTASSSSLDIVDPADGAITNVGTSVFASEESIPSVSIAQNAVFFSNGTDTDRQKVLRVGASLAIQPWGLETPDVTGIVVSHGGAGVMDGEYEIALSYRNENSGAVSNRSVATTVTPSGGEQIEVNWGGVTIESQVTHVKVHIRKTSLTSVFFEAADVTINSSPVSLDLTDAEINQLIILSPSETENTRPPDTIKGSAWHASRMFVFDDVNVYWSGLGTPEQFNPVDFLPINPKDGGSIVTILTVHDSLLLILKSNGTWGLFGTSPSDWELRILYPGTGCQAQHSAQVSDGRVLWWSEDGPVMWTQEGPPVPIGRDLLGDATANTTIDPTKRHLMCSVVDPTRHRVLWSVTKMGESQNAILFPFNTRLGVWESHEWDPFEISAMGVGVDAAGTTWVYVGNPYGRLFEYGSWNYDGARTVNDLDEPLQVKGIVDPANSSSTTLAARPTRPVDLDFDLDGSRLAGLYVTVVNPVSRAWMKRRIVSNTDRVLTVTPAFDWELSTNDLFYIGSPTFEWDTRWEDWGDPFLKKRFTRLHAQVSLSTPTGTDIDYEVYTRLSPSRVVKTITLSGAGDAGYWDVSLWDAAYFGEASVEDFRSWIGRTGRSIRIRVRCFESAVGIALLKIGLECLSMSGKR